MRRHIHTSIWQPLARSTDSSTYKAVSIAVGARRSIQIAATPSTPADQIQTASQNAVTQPDARFEVIGAPFSLLSVSLSASQNLYTRRGSLVALTGKPENVISTLSVLSPFSRALGAVPFLYQKISSTSPITTLLSTRSNSTSFAVVHLDGRLDWIIAQRAGLLAWTGHALTVKSQLNFQMNMGHWGQTYVTGRGLLGLVGKGQIYSISLKSGEEYVASPGNVLAYSVVDGKGPQPYRFKSTNLRFQIPDLTVYLPQSRFLAEMRKTTAYRFFAKIGYTVRTWARRSIWGDGLFLRFQGPGTVLLQSRGSSIRETLTDRDVNEIADSPAGVVRDSLMMGSRKEAGHGSGAVVATDSSAPASQQPTTVSYATVGSDRKVEFKNKQ